MSTKVLPYGRQWIDDTDVDAVVLQLRDDWLTQGPAVAQFEQALCKLTSARFAVAVSSGTAALHLACLVAGMSDRTALVPDNTFVATANAVRYAHGRPRLVDVDHQTGLVDMAALADACTKDAPKAILPVSFAGSVPDLARVRQLADVVGAMVIEDAAHSLGASYLVDGRIHRSASCSHSDMAILSFHPVKHLTTGEGGAITTNDPALCEQLRDLRSHGITKDSARLSRNDGPWYYEQQSLGYNYRLTDIQCALGLSQSRRFPGFLSRRREIALMYDRAFAADDRVAPLVVPYGVTSAYHLYVIRLAQRANESLDGLAARRKKLFIQLRGDGIMPQVHYIPVHHQPDYQRNGLADGAFSGAERYYASCVSIPMYPAMTDSDVETVIRTVRKALDEV